jgi:hypothetical protein
MSTTKPCCGFCGKGPFPSIPGLMRHIRQSVSCHQASKTEFGEYSTNIWNADHPRHTTVVETAPLGVTPDVDLADLTHDLDDATIDFAAQPIEVEEVPTMADTQQRQATCEEVPDEDDPTQMRGPGSDGKAYYFEPYPEERKAGATWGKDVPEFERIKAQLEGGHEWGPFNNEEEWQLAEWLIKNVGQKQTDAYLKLPIVSGSLMS